MPYKLYTVKLDSLDILLAASMAEARIEELKTLKAEKGEASIPAHLADEMIEHYDHLLKSLDSKNAVE